MARGTAAALSERYQALGFRVVEGGKSGDVALLKTPGITEMFGVRHDNVLRDIEAFQSRSSNLRSEFAEHCRSTTYRDSRGKDQPCFELTKVGFATVAAKYDDELRFRLAQAFDALERKDGYAGALVIQQINARIRELREQKSGQPELGLDGPLGINPKSKPTRHHYTDEECFKEIEEARRVGEELAEEYGFKSEHELEPDAPNAFKRDIWIEKIDGTDYIVNKTRDAEGNFDQIEYIRQPEIYTSTHGTVVKAPWVNGRTIKIKCCHIIPLELLERTYFNQIPDSFDKAKVREYLEIFLAF